MKEHNQAPEFHKLPVDAAVPPVEIGQLPAEYIIPEEYPKETGQKTQARRSHAKQIIAMCLAGFMAIQLLFSYFIPPYDPKKFDDEDPGYEQPGGSVSGNGGYNTGDFQIRPLDDSYDDTELKQELINATERLQVFDYVRASLYLYNSMMEQRTGINPYSLDKVGYSVSAGVASDFNAKADACHIYYQSEKLWYENKIGELESYMALRGMLVLMENAPGGTLYRVVSVRISMEQAYGLYGSEVSYYAQYIDGVFDDSGSSNHCQMTEFQVYESDNANLDGMYNVWGDRRLTGSVANGAFMNDTLLEAAIMYDGSGDFVQNTDRPGCNIRVNALLEDGCLDLSDPSVLDQTGSYREDAWEVYKADETLRYLAYTTYVLYKFDGSEEGAELYDLDITKPLLPIDLHAAFCMRQLLSEDDAGEGEEGSIPVLNPDLDLSVLQTGFCTAAQQLMQADYVGAAVSLSDCLRANYTDELHDAYMVSADGQLTAFTGQDLTDGSGVYIRCANEIVQIYNPKADDYEPENHFIITLIFAFDAGKGDTYTQVLTLDIPSYYLGDYDIYHAATKYWVGELDDFFDAYDAQQVSFTLSASNADTDARYREGYLLSNIWMIKGSVDNLHFNGQVLYRANNHLTLNDQKTAVSWTEDMEYYAFMLDLTGSGALDIDNISYQDDRGYEAGSAEDEAALEAFRSGEHAYLYRIGNATNGDDRLSVKAIENPEGERVTALLHMNVTLWGNERFPLTYTLRIWKEYSAHIQ